MMLYNANLTIYEKDTFTKHYITDVYWNDSRGRTVTKGGIQISDQVIVYLYGFSYVPKAGDIIVKGECDFTFDASTERSKSASMQTFRASNPGFAVVKTVLDAQYGGLPHIEITAR
jgi:hypothetical protein